MEGPPALDRSLKAGYWSGWIRPEGPARRIQETEFRSIPGDARPNRPEYDSVAIQSSGRRGTTTGSPATTKGGSSLGPQLHGSQSGCNGGGRRGRQGQDCDA